ncbi:dienelactone hydrolase family protein [Saccharopolyspora rosea]|uniref:Dienelactone hydrolase family protein n=1 Tax=Saccharopolyspora rosea TaxID=524884 RepID=A0ABW3FR05_9PSEU|nr:dienelactone hydrolase family protein [Saccharopolyspora rosea]
MAAVQISTGGSTIPAYLATPLPTVSGPGPWPGVVVVHDVFGLSDDIRSIADRFATAGYLAVVPDLYSRGGAVRCVRSVMRDLRQARGRAFDDVDAAREFLQDRADCTGKVGVAGFCLGGGFAIVGATRGFDASAPYYGQLPTDPSILDEACPVVASFGAKDPGLRGAASELAAELARRDIPHDVKEYPDAGHGFANRLPLGPFNALARVVGFGYHHDSSEDAWKRVLTFFAEHLRSGDHPA